MSAAVCPLKRCRTVLVIEVVRGGRVVTTCPGCERRLAGVCKDCPRRVYGAIGKALRCEACAQRARRDQEAKYRHDPDAKRRINARDRKRRKQDPAYRQRRCELGASWRARNPEKKRKAARRLLLSEGPSRQKYLETQRRHNADPARREKKRRALLAKYYERHPVRPDPHCAGCRGKLAWSGKGSPPKWCDGCCTRGERSRRRRLGRTIAIVAERVA